MEGKSFLKALLDFNFTDFITGKVIKFLYILSLIGIVLGALGIIVAGFQGGFAAGLLALIIGAPLFILIATILTRVYMEIIIILFKIYETLKSIDSKK
ncbi:MAG TPA: DUF4282 domain-containing protein [Candidatus Mcinerneyibacteriales bacterium]|nr:DUF4282 domain-containing protein [Candidatus Mcinerneyibacteriota bacterium]HOO58982.1 DUF4282 domain-containing protein [Candidatus Mcinerneyibacteriales bacterium]HPE21147.1 DUF4282 domain-containing protein [Candidatus Mcinerneyibacteriales bacterium]HPJ69522.1 DUF4282 domain-containing protein [Candidatus Mcinerneyibacteriales bacterium]HPQ88690.1 DUF4282 domain-containing protein [Candidatus Mcinerneyibacteriales bacterium]